MVVRLTVYLELYEIFCFIQFGFTSGYSTSIAETIKKILDNNKLVDFTASSTQA